MNKNKIFSYSIMSFANYSFNPSVFYAVPDGLPVILPDVPLNSVNDEIVPLCLRDDGTNIVIPFTDGKGGSLDMSSRLSLAINPLETAVQKIQISICRCDALGGSLIPIATSIFNAANTSGGVTMGQGNVVYRMCVSRSAYVLPEGQSFWFCLVAYVNGCPVGGSQVASIDFAITRVADSATYSSIPIV
jgi:hypothetical protein